jgi:hypothetical protein
LGSDPASAKYLAGLPVTDAVAENRTERSDPRLSAHGQDALSPEQIGGCVRGWPGRQCGGAGAGA